MKTRNVTVTTTHLNHREGRSENAGGGVDNQHSGTIKD